MRACRLLILVVGCGRIDFGAQVDGRVDVLGDDASGDRPADAFVLACPAFATFCDDFESGDLAKWTGARLSTGGTVVVDSARVHTGIDALDATMPPAANGDSAVTCEQFAAQSTGMLAMREWVNTSTSLALFNSILEFENVVTCTDVETEYIVVGCDNSNDWVATENSTGGSMDHHGTPCAPSDTWTCVELDYTLGAAPRVQVFVDDTIAIDAAPVDPTPTFDVVTAGVANARAAGFEAYVDDVVVAHQHIGCE